MKVIYSLAVLLLAAYVGVIAQVFVKKSISPGGIATEQTLAEVAKEINKDTPRQIDENTRLMNVVALGKTLTYHYRLTNASHEDYLKGTIETLHGDRLKSSVCTAEGMRPVVKLGAVLEYAYHDKNGVELDVISIETSKCQ
jgi:hypothetical protein